MYVYDETTGNFERITSTIGSFYKPSSTATGTTLNSNWMELPALPSSLGDREAVTMYASGQRNYSILYDSSYYASMWTAYHYCSSFSGSGTLSNWEENPSINGPQVSVASSYVSSGNDDYDRGHQIPNGSRNAVVAMQKQTYYYTNSTPQLDQFNQQIWNNLETAERGLVSSKTDTIYVVTGPVFKTVGGNETYKTISHDNKSVPVPNYYYKVILKVKRNSSGTVTSASAIGFWFPHTNSIAGDSYSNSEYVKSVDTIESYTGLNFFANLPSSVEVTAEQNSSWDTFRSF